MSKKTELINLFMGYKKEYEAVQTKVHEIRQSAAYTEEGKEQAINHILEGFTPTVQLYHDKAAGLIAKGLESLTEMWRKNSTGKLMDGGYQAGLANVIKMLEMGAVNTKEDVQNVVDTYVGDFNALSMIRNILSQSDKEENQMLAALVPNDTRERSKQLLNQLKDNVDAYINIFTLKSNSKSWNGFNQGQSSVSMSMDGMMQFVTDKLKDDLEVTE